MKFCDWLVLFVWLIILLVIFVMTSCSPVPVHSKTHRARVTFYCSHEDKYGSRIASGGQAKEGVTMAAPAVIPFNTTVVIPLLRGVVGSGGFIVQDRGRALEKAYRRGQLRLDVYVASRKKLRQFTHGVPEYMEAKIE